MSIVFKTGDIRGQSVLTLGTGAGKNWVGCDIFSKDTWGGGMKLSGEFLRNMTSFKGKV